jgi:hypothetical protein
MHLEEKMSEVWASVEFIRLLHNPNVSKIIESVNPKGIALFKIRRS